ncbi:MAG: DUF3391 domain-containing protein [Pseudomonadales bacterium]|nr:DUF3391 domain-containing protein [Pseudomonadales bacterium]
MSSGIYRRMPVNQLEEGMYITSLDIPMIQTCFPVRGFYIQGREDIQKIAGYCNFAIVNITKSHAVKRCTTVMQLELQELPAVMSGRRNLGQVQQRRLPQKTAHKGRAKRLCLLLVISFTIMCFI